MEVKILRKAVLVICGSSMLTTYSTGQQILTKRKDVRLRAKNGSWSHLQESHLLRYLIIRESFRKLIKNLSFMAV